MDKTKRIEQIQETLQRLADLKSTASSSQLIAISREERGLNFELKNLLREQIESQKKSELTQIDKEIIAKLDALYMSKFIIKGRRKN